MATYSFSTSPNEEAALTWATNQYNTQVVPPTDPPIVPLNNAQFIRKRIDGMLNFLLAELRDTRKAAIEQKYNDATAAVKAQVNTALGYTE